MHRRIHLRTEDLQRLQDGGWLNDQIVNLYFILIEKECPNVSVLDVFFYTNIVTEKPVDAFLKQDLFTRDIVLIPVEEASHWSLVVLDMENKCVKTLDSGFSPNKCGNIIRTFLETSEDCPSDWCIRKMKYLPKQENGSDCGVFMCQYAVCQAYGIDINFSQEDIPQFRKAMMLECIIGGLLQRM